MTAGAAIPANTAAVVVGVEDYADLNWAVRGPAANARRFASWLEGRGVPAERITLLVSPLERTAEPLRPATAEEVRNALMDLRRVDCAGLIVYWCGHGAEDEDGQRLFFADSLASRLDLGVNRLLGWLTDEEIEADDQLLIVDACRDPAAYIGANSLPISFPTRQRAGNRRQSLLQSVGIGELADVEAAGNTTPFTRLLLETLDSAELRNAWLPDVDVLAKRVGAQLEKSPVTVRLTHRDPRGQGATTTYGEPARRAARVRRALGNVPTMADPRNRDELTWQLVKGFGYDFPAVAQPTLDWIVDTLAEQEEGWSVLRKVGEVRSDLFVPNKRSVRALMNLLDELIQNGDSVGDADSEH